MSTHNADYLITELRVLTMPETTLLCARCEPAPLEQLGAVFEPMMADLDRAQKAAGIYPAGAIHVRYYPAADGPEGRLYTMEVGVRVPEGTAAEGPAMILTMPAQRCAGLLLWGSLAHIMEAYGALGKGVDAAGLERTGEFREIHYYFEGDESPRSV
ncbi:MAG: hypothetical protein ACYCYF_00845, partial [Anaerolineae bacterium]